MEIKTIVLKTNSGLIRICICIHLIDYQLFQEKSKEKKTIPGRKEEEKTRKKLTITETQVMDNLFFKGVILVHEMKTIFNVRYFFQIVIRPVLNKIK